VGLGGPTRGGDGDGLLEAERGEDRAAAHVHAQRATPALEVAVQGPVLDHEVPVEGEASLGADVLAPAFEEDEEEDEEAEEGEAADDAANYGGRF